MQAILFPAWIGSGGAGGGLPPPPVPSRELRLPAQPASISPTASKTVENFNFTLFPLDPGNTF